MYREQYLKFGSTLPDANLTSSGLQRDGSTVKWKCINQKSISCKHLNKHGNKFLYYIRWIIQHMMLKINSLLTAIVHAT
uniref:Uncharacterized protein n=1 Tax=Arundo donax TaxID=35708 RepID=A0A0A9HD12_ARUDO